ncbi:hypothetical protein EYC59_01530 [Candidatus Saccharibacteria bacterium]|nr:MAG: hypothetical protein EYC59_01530 [Candidatus Saccharibacteria bacterium]
MGEYLQDDERLIMGRAGMLLPEFPNSKQYRMYRGNIFRAVTEWTQKVLQANQVAGGGNQYHPHQIPEQLILPATADLPLLIIKSVKRGMQVAGSYKPNSNHAEAGYLIPSKYVTSQRQTAIEVAPTVVSTGFDSLFASTTTMSRYESHTSIVIGDERFSSLESESQSSYNSYKPTQERAVLPHVEAILSQLGYSAEAFAGPDTITAEEYSRQVCERFDPEWRHAAATSV